MKGLMAILFLATLSASAQRDALDVASPHPPALPPAVPLQLLPRIGITDEVELSLDDVIRAALANNRDIEVSRLSRVKAKLGLMSAKGYFDPVFGGNAYVAKTVSPVASSLGGAINGAVTEKDVYADPQISGNSPWLGGTYKLDYASSRVDSNSTFNTLNPTYPTAATLNLTQPLWSGLLDDANRERVSVSRKNLQQTEEQFRQRVIDSTTQAIRAYWELDYARRNLEIQVEAVRLAEQQDASNRRQVEQGTQAPIDVIQTQTQLSTYKQNVLAAQQQLTQAEDTLKALILPDRMNPLWSAALKTSLPTEASVPMPSLQDALHDALMHRPDLKAGRIGVEVSALDARLAHEQAKPQINLTAEVETQGLAGRNVPQTTSIFGSVFTDLFTQVNELSTIAGLPPLSTAGLGSTGSTPDFFVGGYGQSFSNLRDVRFPTIKVGIQVSLPIRNRTALAQAGIATANVRQSRTTQQQLEMTAESEVRNTLQQWTNSELILTESQRAAALAEQQYESEQRQFRAGTSSVFLVLQRQTELINAKLREVRATADLGESEAEFDRATATTLERQHIEIEKAP